MTANHAWGRWVFRSGVPGARSEPVSKPVRDENLSLFLARTHQRTENLPVTSGAGA